MFARITIVCATLVFLLFTSPATQSGTRDIPHIVSFAVHGYSFERQVIFLETLTEIDTQTLPFYIVVNPGGPKSWNLTLYEIVSQKQIDVGKMYACPSKLPKRLYYIRWSNSKTTTSPDLNDGSAAARTFSVCRISEEELELLRKKILEGKQ